MDPCCRCQYRTSPSHDIQLFMQTAICVASQYQLNSALVCAPCAAQHNSILTSHLLGVPRIQHSTCIHMLLPASGLAQQACNAGRTIAVFRTRSAAQKSRRCCTTSLCLSHSLSLLMVVGTEALQFLPSPPTMSYCRSSPE